MMDDQKIIQNIIKELTTSLMQFNLAAISLVPKVRFVIDGVKNYGIEILNEQYNHTKTVGPNMSFDRCQQLTKEIIDGLLSSGEFASTSYPNLPWEVFYPASQIAPKEAPLVFRQITDRYPANEEAMVEKWHLFLLAKLQLACSNRDPDLLSADAVGYFSFAQPNIVTMPSAMTALTKELDVNVSLPFVFENRPPIAADKVAKYLLPTPYKTGSDQVSTTSMDGILRSREKLLGILKENPDIVMWNSEVGGAVKFTSSMAIKRAIRRFLPGLFSDLVYVKQRLILKSTQAQDMQALLQEIVNFSNSEKSKGREGVTLLSQFDCGRQIGFWKSISSCYNGAVPLSYHKEYGDYVMVLTGRELVSSCCVFMPFCNNLLAWEESMHLFIQFLYEEIENGNTSLFRDDYGNIHF